MQNHSSAIINRRLDYIFILNNLQEFSNGTDIIPAFKTDNSSVLVTISNYNFLKRGQGLWKFNNSLMNDETFTNTFNIQNMINKPNTKTSLNNQLKWDLLKYGIRRFTISYCKQSTKQDVRERKYLEYKLKNLENVLDNDNNLESYLNDKIEEIYEKKAEGARMRSKCLWYEKSSKLFLNLEKHRGIQGQVRKLIVNNQEVTHQNKIQNKLFL